ncbi:hypothetical protein RV09_GL000882 [Enterococcus moraviensis]|nr:hypothetical protein RV09_GL000882 [Enterococcus moraviensis]
MNKEEEEDKVIGTYRKNEEKIVVDVIKTYEDVKEITFTMVQENNMTGYTHYAFTLNGDEGYSYLFSKNEMYGNESVVNPDMKKRESELNGDQISKELKQVKVSYGGWDS